MSHEWPTGRRVPHGFTHHSSLITHHSKKMPQHATTVTEYCAAVVRSRLIPEADVRDLHQRWKAEGKGADADVDLFRKFLVAKRCLTEYQAALIQRGRPDGFFVGGYVILDRLGKGQSAGVYKAVHTS